MVLISAPKSFKLLLNILVAVAPLPLEILCGVESKSTRLVFLPSTTNTSFSTLSTVMFTVVLPSVDVNVTVFPAANVPDIPPNLILVLPSEYFPCVLSYAYILRFAK